MKINRISEEKKAPSWAFEDVNAADFLDEKYLSPEEVKRIERLPLSDLTDNDIVEQRERIEQCSKDGSIYHYNSQWKSDIQSSLKEYAMVCGMDVSKFKAVHPVDIESIKVIERDAFDRMVVKMTSAENKEKEKVGNMLQDPFKLDERANTDHMNKANWQDVKKQVNLTDKPSMMTASVKPVRGGEDYFENPVSKVGNGQNSIADPNAIGVFAESSIEDTGARLKRENEDKKSQKKINHKEWQQSKVDEMKGLEIIPKGTVFPTESMNAQPGIKGKIFDFDSVPDKTEGEKIAEGNEKRRKSIQGEDKESPEFKNSSSVCRISDTFGDALAKALKENEDN